MRKKHKKRLRKKDIVKRRIIITTSLFCLTFMLAIGYSVFNTNINLSVKSNIYDKRDLCFETSDNGDGTVTITNYDKTCGSEVNIPPTIKGKIVTKINDASSNINTTPNSFCNKTLTNVTIPDTIKYIGKFAFYANKIKTLNLGNGVEEINDEAFHGNQLTNIIFPSSLKKIGQGAFLDNYLTSIPSLENIDYGRGAFTLNNINPENAFIYEKNSDGSTDYTTLNSYAARKWVDNLNIPNTVKKIEYYSLRFAQTRVITFQEGVERIEGFALLQTNAEEINLPSTTASINSYAFNQCPNIKIININRKENAISGAPWGATNATINWTGTN